MPWVDASQQVATISGVTFPRGTSLLSGSAFGDVVFTATAPLVSADAQPLELLRALDATRNDLAEDERIVFLLGYEACCALLPGEPYRPTEPRFGPPLGAWRGRVQAPSSRATTMTTTTTSPTLTTTARARDAHLMRIAACHEQLLDGVIYQANLAHRLDVEAADHAAGVDFFLARRGRLACAALLDLPGFGSLISLSPERFVAADFTTKRATTWPIKGTVLRGDNDVADVAAVAVLCASLKDQAEHVMIVDLLRNDLGKVAVVGGVDVDSLMHVVSTSAVHHLESTITARLRDDVGVTELLVATAPGGSITGAPKSSAVEVIALLEEGPRGAYTGVLGMVDGHGHLMTSLLIRTWIRPDDGPGALHVGGGIVVDSTPEAEWRETLDKAAAFGAVVVLESAD